MAPDVTPTGRPRPVILYVDDQEGNLCVFRANLRRHAEIHTASSAAQALQMLEQQVFPIIISDQRMDGMTGSEFLSVVRQRWPETIRFLLTAHADFAAVVDAINGGQISGFVRKPWQRTELAELITQANDAYWAAREEHALSEAFIDKARLAALGQMTAGFAHELGNLGEKLAMIETIMDRWGVKEGDIPELDTVRRGVMGVRQLADTVLKLAASTDDTAAETFDLVQALPTWLVGFRLFDGVRHLKALRLGPLPDALPVCIAPRRVELALLQLVLNAAEACPAGLGEVEITVAVDGDLLRLQVCDDGPGIQKELHSRIWEPTFSERGGRHAGLGLTTTRNLLHALGGEVRLLQSEPGRTVFEICLPQRAAAAATDRLSA